MIKMSIFFKIGLPWAISLGIIFYLGLELGSHSDSQPEQSANGADHVNDGPINQPNAIQSTEISSNLDKIIKPPIEELRKEQEVVYSPPLPPNLRRIMEDGSILERMGAYMDALRRMDTSNLGEVVDAFEALPKGYGRHLEMKLLMRSWANLDPVGALSYAQSSLDEKSERRFAMSEVLAGWAVRDSTAAISWAKQYQADNPESKEGANLMVGIVKGLAEDDLNIADDFFRTLPEGSAKWQASTFLVQEFAELGTDEAIRWAEQFPGEDERMRSMIFGQLSSKLAQKDLEGAATWAASMPVGKASEQVVSNLLSRWTSQDPQQAAEWASQIQESEKRVQAMKLLTNKWSLRDPVATASWLNNFPPSEELDPVVGEFVNRISSRDPEGAVGWANSIINEEQKEKVLSKALQAWDRKSPEQAKAWRIQNNVPLEQESSGN